MDSVVIELHTGNRQVVDVTQVAADFVEAKGDGLLHLFLPHATAGLAIIEVGAGTESDLVSRMEAILPRRDDLYRHRHGSPGHGADHVLPALVSPSLVVPVAQGRLALGTWQSIVVVDPNRDNPNRQLRLSLLGG